MSNNINEEQVKEALESGYAQSEALLNDKDEFVEKVYELMNNNKKYENYRKMSFVRANDFSMESNKAKLKELIENINEISK